MKPLRCTSARVLVAIVSRFYGLTLKEIMDEAKISRREAYHTLRSLEKLGVQFQRKQEAIRGGWRMIYRVEAIRGNRFDLRRQAQ